MAPETFMAKAGETWIENDAVNAVDLGPFDFNFRDLTP
jgi:hypothetical protein